MESKKNAIVLGGTSPHIELIKKLKARGYSTILVDYLNTPPAKKVADKHIKESTLDVEKVYRIAKENDAKLVISACIDQANATACYVAEKMGLPAPYSYETAIHVTNKKYMKQIFKENQIPTADFYTLNHIEQLESDRLKFPVVVKPVDCNSSKGVRRADTIEELQNYAKQALELSREYQAVVEEFCEGYEIQVDCLALKNDVQVLMTRQKKKILNKKGLVLQSTGSVIPAKLSCVLRDKIYETATKIANAFGLKNTPFFFQAIVRGDNIFILEFAPRIGGGLSSYLLKEVTGVDILDTAIDSYIGNEIEEKEVREKCCETTLLYVEPGVFDKIDGLEDMKEKGIIKEYFVYKSSGTEMDADMCSSNRVGAFVIEADTEEELTKKQRIAMQNIRVLDATGREMLKKDLY
ncbi:MAG: ATP-grasp domain-containing protein [Lachnospiraceae bacterium]